MTKNLSLLGSTGSIGTQSLDVARKRGYRVRALSAFQTSKNRGTDSRIQTGCRGAGIRGCGKGFKGARSRYGHKILSGSEGVCECAAYDKSDTVLNSVVGMAGLEPTLTAIKAHKNWRLPIKRLLLPAADLLWTLPKGKMSIFFPWIPNTRLYFRLFRGNLLTGR